MIGGWRSRLPRWLRPCHIVKHTGLRGLILLALGVLDLLYGFTLAWPTIDQVQSVRYHVIIDILPGLGTTASLWAWALLWWAAGAACLFYAWRDDDAPGYACAVGLKVAWAVVNLIGYVRNPPEGSGQVLVWTFFAVVVAIASRMAEPVRNDREP